MAVWGKSNGWIYMVKIEENEQNVKTQIFRLTTNNH